MPKIAYQKFRFHGGTLAMIEKANEIIASYQAQGFDLTLRQLYYQFVARDIIPNRQKEYTRLASIVNDARLAGLIDWSAIVDRTRNLQKLSAWNSPSEILDAVANQYHINLWEGQEYQVEVWIEKDALAGILDSVCPELDVPYFSCRGYTSQSEMWSAAQRMIQRWRKHRQKTLVFHFGDHDPSGIDMTRDISDRITMFTEYHVLSPSIFEMKRLALNMAQIEEYNPPPNPAKVTDSRFLEYQRLHGDESWELDALEPTVLADLIRNNVEEYVDRAMMDERIAERQTSRDQLALLADRWDDVTSFLNDRE